MDLTDMRACKESMRYDTTFDCACLLVSVFTIHHKAQQERADRPDRLDTRCITQSTLLIIQHDVALSQHKQTSIIRNTKGTSHFQRLMDLFGIEFFVLCPFSSFAKVQNEYLLNTEIIHSFRAYGIWEFYWQNVLMM